MWGLLLLLVIGCFCMFVSTFVESTLPPKIETQVSNYTSGSPQDKLIVKCTSVDRLFLNGVELGRNTVKEVCKGEGIPVTLEDGENKFVFESTNSNGSAMLEITVNFDEKSYNQKLEEQKKSEEEKEKERQAAEDLKRKQDEERRKREETEAKKPKEGDVLKGKSIEQIWFENDKQKELSDLKAEQYRNSLAGHQVVWVGTVKDVDREFLGGGYQIYVHMGGGLFDSQDFFVDDSKRQYGNLVKGQLIKVTAKIQSVSEPLGGIIITLENAKIEVIK